MAKGTTKRSLLFQVLSLTPLLVLCFSSSLFNHSNCRFLHHDSVVTCGYVYVSVYKLVVGAVENGGKVTILFVTRAIHQPPRLEVQQLQKHTLETPLKHNKK